MVGWSSSLSATYLALATTPTISRPSYPPSRTRCPIGLSVLKWRRDIASLIRATRGDPIRSCGAKSRPASVAIDAAASGVHGHQDDVFAVEPCIERAQVSKARHQQRRAGEKDQRERHLRGNQRPGTERNRAACVVTRWT